MQPDSHACSRKRKRRGNRHSMEAAPPLSPSVILFYNHRSGKVSCSVYALNTAAVLEDNGDDTKPLPPPLFRFEKKKFPILPGYAALGSKIYIFGGMNSAEACKDNPALEKYSSDTYVFDTTQHLPPPSDDPKAFLLKGPSLNAPKYHPISVVFKGKIYVFPSRFSCQAMLSKTPMLGPKCELLDHGLWTALPDPPLLDQHVQGRLDIQSPVSLYKDAEFHHFVLRLITTF
ncbi:Kelch repeat type 1 [Corchorus capsularis]|uniref:Kelch repeat type 1 n=1 Tax=Corchorus capsularis TaxID=210143 RepID=A0A1R3G1B9_COCAP|nr:Kelch repeat type 1 [Corchorus capsularis]